jgi:hypothetical protein
MHPQPARLHRKLTPYLIPHSSYLVAVSIEKTHPSAPRQLAGVSLLIRICARIDGRKCHVTRIEL